MYRALVPLVIMCQQGFPLSQLSVSWHPSSGTSCGAVAVRATELGPLPVSTPPQGLLWWTLVEASLNATAPWRLPFL